MLYVAVTYFHAASWILFFISWSDEALLANALWIRIFTFAFRGPRQIIWCCFFASSEGSTRDPIYVALGVLIPYWWGIVSGHTL